MFGLGMANDGLVGRFARVFENLVLRSFDRVSTISLSMMSKALEKGVCKERLIFFPNWSDTSKFIGVTASEQLRSELGVTAGNKMVLYSGNIGDKQGLEQVIEAAEKLCDKPYDFVIVGDGAGKEKLKTLAASKNLKNVHFAALLPFEQLPFLLASADCHLVIQKRGVADAVLPSKLTNILAVGGNAVITAEVDTELGILCSEYAGIAELVEPEDVDALIDGIGRALNRDIPNKMAADYAQENIDCEKVLRNFEMEIFSLCSFD